MIGKISLTKVDLHKIPLFASLGDAEYAQLITDLRALEVRAGEILFREGEPGDRFLIILDGELEIIKSIGTPDERSFGTRGAGDLIGEISMFEPDGLRTASVRAFSPARLLEMTRANFDRLIHNSPSLAFEVSRVISNRLRQSETAAMHDLHEKNLQLTEAYQHLKAAQAQIIEKEKMEQELLLARRIQESMLPRVLPEFPGFDFGARILPARVVGGDLFDVFLLDSQHAAVVIGDVSDKGVPAALFMAMVRSLVRAEACHAYTTAEVLDRLNGHLLEMNEMGLFVTMIYGVVNRERCEFSYTRAGHELPLLCNCSGTPIPTLQDHGRLLGVLPDVHLVEQTIALHPGDTLLLYTDGAIDALDSHGIRFGYERLAMSLGACLDRSAQDICDRLLAILQDYHGETSQTDDITLVAMKVK